MKNEPNKTKKTNVGADASVRPNPTKAYKNCRGTGHRAQEPAAITLVALVITIIILIILAGVSLNLALGQNGIFVKSKKAVDKYKDSAQKEQNEMDNLYNTLVGLGTGETGGGSTAVTDGSYDEKRGCNTPLIKPNPDANTTMQLVKYEDETWVPDTDGTSWSYVAGTGNDDNTSSHWANAKVTIDNVESYFVWIPRFAYKITPKQSGQAAGTIDVVFLQGTTDTYIDENGEEKEAKRATDDDIGNGVYLEDYIVHPAFTKTVKNGVQTYDNGEWSEELEGLWIGKYETSHTGCTTTASSGEGTLNGNKIKIQPGITSWRKDTIGNFYTAAINYSEDLNSHMLKNSEWGAVAYLTHSQYGRNGHEISINNSSDYITETGDNKASSTGNEYGIYDLSGGAYEYVATYYNGGSTLETYGRSFASQNKPSDKYSTVYAGKDKSSYYKKGDATNETSGWNSDTTHFVSQSCPFFIRGGYYDFVSDAGVFYHNDDNGQGGAEGSFRVCLAVM